VVEIAIVHEARIPPKSCRALLREARKIGLRAHYIPIKYISVEIGEKTGLYVGSKELDINGILLRGLGFSVNNETYISRVTILKVLENLGVRIMNPVNSLLNARNKFYTLFIAKKLGINVPNTMLTEDIMFAYNYIDKMGEITLKPIVGSRGFGLSRFSDKDTAFQAMRALLEYNLPLMVQKYLVNPLRDMRIFVIGDRVVASMYRLAPSGGWKANIAQGGTGVKYDPDPEVINLALKITRALNLDYAGVDVIESGGRYFLLEVNASADFDELSRVTRKNIAREIVMYFKEILKK